MSQNDAVARFKLKINTLISLWDLNRLESFKLKG